MRKTMIKKSIILSGIFIIASLFVGCQGNSIVSGVDIQSLTIDGRANIQITTSFNNFGVYLPGMSVPIKKPHTDYEFGAVEILPNLMTGGMDVSVRVDLQTIMNSDELPNGTLLPNGQTLPLAGVSYDTTFAIPIQAGDNVKLYIYFNLSNEFSMLGFAISIKQMSVITDYVGGLTFFPVITDGNGHVLGSAGIYLGEDDFENGIAAFINITGIIQAAWPEMLNKAYEDGFGSVAEMKVGNPDAQILSREISGGQYRKLIKGLNKMRRLHGNKIELQY